MRNRDHAGRRKGKGLGNWGSAGSNAEKNGSRTMADCGVSGHMFPAPRTNRWKGGSGAPCGGREIPANRQTCLPGNPILVGRISRDFLTPGGRAKGSSKIAWSRPKGARAKGVPAGFSKAFSLCIAASAATHGHVLETMGKTDWDFAKKRWGPHRQPSAAGGFSLADGFSRRRR